MQEENKTVDIDTSGPAVDVELPEDCLLYTSDAADE